LYNLIPELLELGVFYLDWVYLLRLNP
jgi:hypothetical protein